MTSSLPPTVRNPTPLDRAFLTDADDVTEVVLVRHGQQSFPDPATARVGDWVDPPLSEIGRRQAAAVGRYLSTARVEAVYSSQLSRAHDTGKAIAGHHGLEPVVAEDLREVEIFRDVPADVTSSEAFGEIVIRGARERFVRHRSWDVYPGSERGTEFRHRTVNVIEGIIATHPGTRVVVACHGGVINAYVGEILGLATDMFFRPGHASVHRVLARGDVRSLRSLNETHHLAGESQELVTY